jgi:hypothetical protein
MIFVDEIPYWNLDEINSRIVLNPLWINKYDKDIVTIKSDIHEIILIGWPMLMIGPNVKV